jgi:hypothetical protein
MKFSRYVEFLAVFATLCLAYRLPAFESRDAVCTADPSSALIFVGTLKDLTSTGAHSGWSLATFNVNEFLQGESSTVVSTLMRDDLCGDSGENPTLGKAYLILTHVSPKGTPRSVYQLEHCEQIYPLSQANALLDYLRSSQRRITPTEVSGEARVETHGYGWKNVPLPKTRIHLVGQNQRLDFVSDEDGQFHAALGPGKYMITAEFPAGYELDYGDPPAITVTDHRCTKVTVSGHPTASITAHIVDIDEGPLGPMSSVQLSLETAGDQQFVQSVWPDENSDLKANNLLPGQYILGLNTYLGVDRGSAPYPPTYFPGVPARSEAQIITLRPGEQKVLQEIPVSVIDSFGKPSRSTAVALAYRDYPRYYIEPREQTDEDGREAVYAVFPGHVLLRAEKQLKHGSTVKSEPLEVNSCPTGPVSLKLRVVADQPESKKE